MSDSILLSLITYSLDRYVIEERVQREKILMRMYIYASLKYLQVYLI